MTVLIPNQVIASGASLQTDPVGFGPYTIWVACLSGLPDGPVIAKLQVTVDNVNWITTDVRELGVASNFVYFQCFRLSDCYNKHPFIDPQFILALNPATALLGGNMINWRIEIDNKSNSPITVVAYD